MYATNRSISSLSPTSHALYIACGRNIMLTQSKDNACIATTGGSKSVLGKINGGMLNDGDCPNENFVNFTCVDSTV
jgi:hypothetical protein